MNILRVIGSMAPSQGGPCQGIRNSIPELSKLGLVNEVASLDADDAGFLGVDSFPIHALGPGRGPWAYNRKLVPWLIENLPRYDVVIIHGLWLHHSYAVHKALKTLRNREPLSRARIPRCFVMPHGMLDPYFQRDSSRRWKAVRNWIYWKLVERRVVNDADGILFTCEQEMRLARETFKGYQPRQQLNIGYGVAEPPARASAMETAFAAACPGLGARPYLLFLSRIHPKKGVDLLIRAYAEFARSATQYLPALVIAGPLNSAYASEMQNLASGLLPDSGSQFPAPAILFPGMLSGDAKWGAFHGCEAFILPSHQENFGIAVVEALACGKPVLISKQVNIWREIIESEAGWAEDDTLDGARYLLNKWLNHYGNGSTIRAESARSCFMRHFTIRHFSHSLIQVIHNQ